MNNLESVDINEMDKYLKGPGKYSKSVAKYCKENGIHNYMVVSVVFTHIWHWQTYNEIIERADNFIDGKYRVYFSYSKIAEMLGDIGDRQTIKRAIEQLDKLGLIEIIPKNGLCSWYCISDKGLEIGKFDNYWVFNDAKYSADKNKNNNILANDLAENTTSQTISSNVVQGGLFDGIPIK